MTAGSSTNDGVHQLWYLGSTEMPASIRVDREIVGEVRSIEERLIDHCEAAQLRGDLPADSNDCRLVAVHISKHGVKMTDVNDESVVDRLALHNIVQSVAYDDGSGRSNVILRVKQRTTNEAYICHLFQAQNANDADHLCKQLRQVFNSVVR